MKLEVGKLYICEEYFLLLYPDQEACATAAARAIGSVAASRRRGSSSPPHAEASFSADASAAYWTRKLGKSVSYTEKKVPILVLSVKEKYIEVLAGDKKGWIIVKDWLELKEIDCA